ncbi:efflux RND transporter periplasmic adaptor subunit [Thalassotalea psychrophila]|uniref:Efflux RND transporter periplasmic adaptor subunit n=1 Tax=Thalassotalea psychrophila TaxID=3065647 RepID=A0ABY9U298_9GAMM|nr:efflux RND transporter periplasmic adaptor subunit [Colwelliaceae bacterium SQ149]
MNTAKLFPCILSLFILSACNEPQVIAPEKVEVIVTQLSQKNIPLYGHYIANTQASLDVEVRARVEGYLEQQHFLEGSFVIKDQLLYSIDDGPYQAALASAQASHIQAKNALAKANRDVKRIKPLYEQDASSQLDLDNAFADLDSAQASLKSAEASLQQSELELSYTQIRAPISGVVSASNADIGALVGGSGISLLTNVQKVDPLFIEFQMTTLDYLQARRRLKSYYEKYKADIEGTSVEGLVTITLPDGSEYPHLGQMKFTAPKANQETATFTARAEIINPDRELLPGQYTKARIQLDELDNSLLLPEQAVKFEQSGSFVYVVLPQNTIERRFVVLGRNVGGSFLVQSGLSNGEKVVLEGTHKVQHGSHVIAIMAKDIKEAAKKAQESENKSQKKAAEKPAKAKEK